MASVLLVVVGFTLVCSLSEERSNCCANETAVLIGVRLVLSAMSMRVALLKRPLNTAQANTCNKVLCC